jgi:RNA polymerase sigma-70 factor (ECF subfamily)
MFFVHAGIKSLSGSYAMEVPEEPLSAATFEDLAMPLFGQLYNFARWLTQDTAEAEDLVQETYTKALRGFSSFQAGTNFRAWIYRILRNSFLSSRSGLKVTIEFDEEDTALAPAERSTPESLLLAQSSRELIWKAMDELPVPFREILLLCEVEEMSYQEISETLSIPPGTVMSRLSRARKALRANLLAKNSGGRHAV